MNIRHQILILIISLVPHLLPGQSETFTVTKAPFSSQNYDEFSPVFYKDGIVFCSNRYSNTIKNYSTSQNKGLFKIHFINTSSGKSSWQDTKLFSNELKTKMNDGPASFNRNGDTIYFSRNLVVDGKLKDINGPRNKLGIFSAVYSEGKWSKIRELRFNNEWYNITTPYLSPDGLKLYFASDKPGGFGGSDIYYSQMKNDYWDNPVNLGPVINTPGNESYPFINQAGELYFSSDGHPGLGGKDIFFSKQVDTSWIAPVRLDAPVNSGADDFGIIIDSTFTGGYFSSNRDKSIDIYQFTMNYIPLFYCENQKTDLTCFYFLDDTCIDIDPINLQFEWDFGDGKKYTGYAVTHCFPGPGKYPVRQNIVEKKTGKLLFNKLSFDLELKLIEQPVIKCNEIALAGENINFDGSRSNLPGYEILNYTWDFGNGEKAKGAQVTCAFKEKGEYLIKLGLTARDRSSGTIKLFCVSKNLVISSDAREMAVFKANAVKTKTESVKIDDYGPAGINKIYDANSELQNDAVFQVEILSSPQRTALSANIFNSISSNYNVKEIFLPGENRYCYIIDEQETFMSVYPALKDAISAGFRDARIRSFIHSDPAEKELVALKKIYGTSADVIFGRTDDKIQPAGFPLLDQLVNLMKKYPDIRILVATHTDNTGVPAVNMSLSYRRAQSIITYIASRGIRNNRLSPAGYGGNRPIASNFVESERRRNRRVEIIIIR